MADGTSVGSVYLDLVLRDTIGRQLTGIAQRATAQANAAFSKTGAAAGESFSQAFGKNFSKSLENAKAKLAGLEEQQRRVGQRMDDWRAATKDLFKGVRDPGQAAQNFLDTDRGFQALAVQNEGLLQKIEQAQARVATETQALAEKQALAAERARARQEAAAQKAAAAEERAAQRAAAQQEQAAERMAGAHEQAAQRAQSAWGGIFSKVFAGAGKLMSGLADKVKGLVSGLGSAGKSASHFGTRLRSIVTGALFFNLISSGLRSLTQSFGQAIASTSQMQGALANLKGAAANAAAPLVQILAPALAKIANAAATVFAYIAKLIALFTGKTISSAKGAASALGGVGSAAGGASKKMKGYLLSMDELNVLQEEADAGGGGGAGAGDILPNYDFEGASPFLDSVLAAIQAGDYYKVGQLFAQKINDSLEAINWAPIQEKAARWASNLATALNGFVEDPTIWQNLGHTLPQSISMMAVLIAVSRPAARPPRSAAACAQLTLLKAAISRAARSWPRADQSKVCRNPCRVSNKILSLSVSRRPSRVQSNSANRVFSPLPRPWPKEIQ